MYLVDPVGSPEHDAARARVDQAIALRRLTKQGTSAYDAAHADLLLAYEEVQRHPDPSYFRLNVWGMGSYLKAMDHVGMLCHPASRPWPEYDSELHDEGMPEHARYEAAVRLVRAAHDIEADGIPSFKFSSNDGWIVLPEECSDALAVWAAASAEDQARAVELADGEDGDGYWYQWLEFLERGVAHQGFEVW